MTQRINLHFKPEQIDELRALFDLKDGESFPDAQAFVDTLKKWRRGHDAFIAQTAGKDVEAALSLSAKCEADRIAQAGQRDESNPIVADARRRAEAAGLS